MDKADRVLAIAEMMATHEWTTNKLERAKLRERWGITEETLKKDAAEASRLLAFDKDELEALRAANVKTFLRIAKDAEARQNAVTGLPDYRSAIEALSRAAEYAGLKLDTEADDKPAGGATIEVVVLPDEEGNE
jgi:hypothetical protein